MVLSVSDTGSGMDVETQQQIFDPFFTTKKIGQGTGLGLATVYGIVKQNKGFISVYSELGLGTTFRIYLPHTKIGPVNTEQPTPGLLQRGDETILLVEDEVSVLRLTKEMLEGLNYKVLTASSAAEALEITGNFNDPIHLLLTDVIMPRVNGLQLSRQLFQRYPDLKVLYMSGYTADVIAQRGVLDEGVMFLEKPFSLKKLSLKMREALA